MSPTLGLCERTRQTNVEATPQVRIQRRSVTGEAVYHDRRKCRSVKLVEARQQFRGSFALMNKHGLVAEGRMRKSANKQNKTQEQNPKCH